MKLELIVIAIGIVVIAGLGSFALLSLDGNVVKDSGKPSVVASFFPFYDITRSVAGEKAQVSVLAPPATEPHAFEPSPGDILNLNKADLFIASGVEFEEWENSVLDGLDTAVPVVHAADGIELLEAASEHSHEEEHEEGHHHEGGMDPHFWVSPKNAIIIALNVRDGLIQIDPANADYYSNQAEEYIQELQELDEEFASTLTGCKQDIILTTHAAFAYLGHEYGFEQVPILGLSPQSEPTPSQIATLIEEAEEHDLKYIFYEELVDPRVSETIASEVGAETLVLNPVAGSDDPQASYLSIMRANLENLGVALECAVQ